LAQPDAKRQTSKAAADDRYAFCFSHDSTDFPGDEKMTERTGALFRELPVLFVRPQRGKFIAGKACAHADRGIVTGDAIAAYRPKQPAAK
jgi:hypothetical protein